MSESVETEFQININGKRRPGTSTMKKESLVSYFTVVHADFKDKCICHSCTECLD